MKPRQELTEEQKKLPIKKRPIEAVTTLPETSSTKYAKTDTTVQAELETKASQPGFFKQPLPVRKTNIHPLRKLFQTHFQFMNPEGLRPYHFSEMLAQIAEFHRAKHATFTSRSDMFPTILFLYEKALVIEPLNDAAKQRHESYQPIIQSDFSSLLFVEAQNRNGRYLQERLTQGHKTFFWRSLDKYIERVQQNYPETSHLEFIELCQYLLNSPSMIRIRQKHMTESQQQALRTVLEATMESLSPGASARLTRTTPVNLF